LHRDAHWCCMENYQQDVCIHRWGNPQRGAGELISPTHSEKSKALAICSSASALGDYLRLVLFRRLVTRGPLATDAHRLGPTCPTRLRISCKCFAGDRLPPNSFPDRIKFGLSSSLRAIRTMAISAHVQGR